ncbi:hypothetical protein JYU34_001526 [Plutella xylostella]|uniref:Uncharacterized protein n=1 Tax=Plutella xylostella TaxID=51655 RepID=A0ABQ7R476_PLUXY|nr:hypothetical protein JYU34_001526 [Plutella xylostella]
MRSAARTPSRHTRPHTCRVWADRGACHMCPQPTHIARATHWLTPVPNPATPNNPTPISEKPKTAAQLKEITLPPAAAIIGANHGKLLANAKLTPAELPQNKT